ncbi:MAG: DNA/RNA helicase domain-containing protein, partial [Burkholderiales bacterium]
YSPSASEENSWKYSINALSKQLKRSELDDHGIILEMQLPLTSLRLDCMVTGTDSKGEDGAVIVELKQWSDAWPAEEEECVTVEYSGHPRVQPHPSVQARNYGDYLRDNKVVFHEAPTVGLTECSWLHNFQPDQESPLLDRTKFGTVLDTTPLFSASDGDELAEFLNSHVGGGDGMRVLDRVVTSRYAPSKKLMEHTAAMIKGEPTYVLLDDQRVAFQMVLAAAKKAKNGRGRTVVLINGGPGTGKSVIALNVMAELLAEGYNVQHATGSRAFTNNLRRILGTRAAYQFKFFNNYVTADAGDIDVLICDEAHRIRESSNNRYTPTGRRSERSQIEELIHASKVSVFFIDDKQVVRPGEVGSSELIRLAAEDAEAKLKEQRLVAQFRCAGSDEYIDWVDQLLEIRSTDQLEFDTRSGFEFKIFDSPERLDDAIRRRAAEGHSARLTAGFCWKWSQPKDGRLVDDVVIGDFRRPWNAQPEAMRLPKDVPKSHFWATDPRGINQVGCVYTAQGFEFDYAGVIWGPDLVHRKDEGWVGVKTASFDGTVKRAQPEYFIDLVKNTYRVLLTRGMKGCYVFFTDEETRRFVISRLSQSAVEV